MYWTIESSDAWGACCFIDKDGNWTKDRNKAHHFNSLKEAKSAQANPGRASLGKIQIYREDK